MGINNSLVYDDLFQVLPQLQELQQAQRANAALKQRLAILERQPAQKSTQMLSGWRTWNLDESGFLTAVTYPTRWPKRVPLKASDNGQPAGVRENDNAGIHAVRSLELLLASGYTAKVIGEVWLWGWVREYDKGFRAEYAYPKSLYMCHDTDPLTIMQLEADYGVKVELDERTGLHLRDLTSFYYPSYTVVYNTLQWAK